MSELKVHRFITTDELFPEANAGVLFYEKSEADKVIAELEMKLASVQQVLRLNKPEALYSDLETMGRLNHEIDVVARRERHQKYKRCIKMAKWCHDKWIMSLGWDPTDGHTADFYLHYEKWEKRWLELAEKFKEAK